MLIKTFRQFVNIYITGHAHIWNVVTMENTLLVITFNAVDGNLQMINY